jgi:hypothetical protein
VITDASAAQTGFFGGAVVAVVGAVGWAIKSFLPAVRELFTARGQLRASHAEENRGLIEVSNGVATGWMTRIDADNVALRKRNAELEQQLRDMQTQHDTQIHDMHVRMDLMRDTINNQGIKIAELLEHLGELPR